MSNQFRESGPWPLTPNVTHSARYGRFCPYFLTLILAAAIFPPARATASTCDKSNPKEDCDIIINPSSFVNGRTFHVRNGTQITIRVVPKSPFEKCSLAVKERQPITEENPFQAFLSAITQAGVPIALLQQEVHAQTRASSSSRTATQTAIARAVNPELAKIQPILQNIRGLLDTIETRESAVSTDLRTQYNQVQALGDRISELRQNPSRGRTALSEMQQVFAQDRERIVADIDVFRSTFTTPDITDVSNNIKTVADLINGNAADILAADPNLLGQLNQELATARATLNTISDAITALGTAKSKLAAQRDFLAALPVEFSATFQYSDTNSVVQHEVSCVDRQSGEATAMGTVTYTIEFKDPPRAALSVGALTSTLDKREIGSVSIKDSTSADGFKTVFGETERAGLQIIPFSFLNVRLWNWTWKRRDIGLYWAEGFGINPNNGGKDPEFFSGISFGFKDLYFQIGGHHGRWQELGGGFRFGDTVPDKLQTIPIQRRYTTHLAFGVSYHIPPK